jgi:hypothetical protein
LRVPELDEYLHRFATQHCCKSISTVFVQVDTETSSLILGYCTLSAAQVDVAELGDEDHKKLPRLPVPRFRIGRLACRADRQGQGLGKLPIGFAV